MQLRAHPFLFFPASEEVPCAARPLGELMPAREVSLPAGDTVLHEQTLERATVGRAQAAPLAPAVIPAPQVGAWGIPTPEIATPGRAREERTALQDLPARCQGWALNIQQHFLFPSCNTGLG